jgi:hypothetical protein
LKELEESSAFPKKARKEVQENKIMQHNNHPLSSSKLREIRERQQQKLTECSRVCFLSIDRSKFFGHIFDLSLSSCWKLLFFLIASRRKKKRKRTTETASISRRF